MITFEDMTMFARTGKVPDGATEKEKEMLRRFKAIELAKAILLLTGQSPIGMAQFAADADYDIEKLTALRNKLILQFGNEHPELAGSPSAAALEREGDNVGGLIQLLRNGIANCDPTEVVEQCRLLRIARGHGSLFTKKDGTP